MTEDRIQRLIELPYPWRDERVLRHLYEEQDLTPREIAHRLECATSTAREWLDRFDIEPRSTNPPSGNVRAGRKGLARQLERMDPDAIGEAAPDGDDDWRGYYARERGDA